MTIIRKDSIITFVKNTDQELAEFDGEEILFSMPYSKVLNAASFCTRENLDFVYIGFKNGEWLTELTEPLFEYSIEVTPNGLSEKTIREFIYAIISPTAF